MLRGVRLINALQQGLTLTEFSAALENPTLAAVVDTLLRRRGASWARSTIDAAAGSLSAAQVAAYLTSGHILSPYITASGVAMSAVASSAEAMAAIASSAEAMAAIASSTEAMAAVLSSGISVPAIFFVPAAKAAIMSSTALTSASVPKMTGATTPSGIASASSSAGAGYLPWLVFDQSSGTFWNSAVVVGGAGNDWIQYSFPTDVFISSVSLTPAASAIYAPKDCAIQYSSDGVTFATAKLITAAATGVQSFEVMMPGFYPHWRLAMYSAQSGLNYLQLAELNFTGFVKPA